MCMCWSTTIHPLGNYKYIHVALYMWVWPLGVGLDLHELELHTMQWIGATALASPDLCAPHGNQGSGITCCLSSYSTSVCPSSSPTSLWATMLPPSHHLLPLLCMVIPLDISAAITALTTDTPPPVPCTSTC